MLYKLPEAVASTNNTWCVYGTKRGRQGGRDKGREGGREERWTDRWKSGRMDEWVGGEMGGWEEMVTRQFLLEHKPSDDISSPLPGPWPPILRSVTRVLVPPHPGPPMGLTKETHLKQQSRVQDQDTGPPTLYCGPWSAGLCLAIVSPCVPGASGMALSWVCPPVLCGQWVSPWGRAGLIHPGLQEHWFLSHLANSYSPFKVQLRCPF